MKQHERVAELLAELRALAETDFERHRIDVLECDLTAPPIVEVIDDTHQRFNGVTYRPIKEGHFVKPQLHLHRVVWEYYHGNIPDGYHIHHVDEDKTNNRIENLQALTASEHRSVHVKNRIAPKICPVCGKSFFTKVKEQICCSPACHAIRQTKPLIEKVCPVCGKTFEVKNKCANQICCSHACSYIHRRKPSTKRICAICGKEFEPTTKHPEVQTCSPSCSAKLRCLNRGDQLFVSRKCVICGKEFTPPWGNANAARTCSHSCAAKLREQTKRAKRAEKQHADK